MTYYVGGTPSRFLCGTKCAFREPSGDAESLAPPEAEGGNCALGNGAVLVRRVTLVAVLVAGGCGEDGKLRAEVAKLRTDSAALKAEVRELRGEFDACVQALRERLSCQTVTLQKLVLIDRLGKTRATLGTFGDLCALSLASADDLPQVEIACGRDVATVSVKEAETGRGVVMGASTAGPSLTVHDRWSSSSSVLDSAEAMKRFADLIQKSRRLWLSLDDRGVGRVTLADGNGKVRAVAGSMSTVVASGIDKGTEKLSPPHAIHLCDETGAVVWSAPAGLLRMEQEIQKLRDGLREALLLLRR